MRDIISPITGKGALDVVCECLEQSPHAYRKELEPQTDRARRGALCIVDKPACGIDEFDNDPDGPISM